MVQSISSRSTQAGVKACGSAPFDTGKDFPPIGVRLLFDIAPGGHVASL